MIRHKSDDPNRDLAARGYNVLNDFDSWEYDRNKLYTLIVDKMEKKYTQKELNKLSNLYTISWWFHFNNLGKEPLMTIFHLIDNYEDFPLFIHDDTRSIKLFVKWLSTVGSKNGQKPNLEK